ncbi:sensor histidine kinase [Chitinophaga silvatica]|uniref:histidine kinase n=1 Tax=Chitinophaga silvatica TaxID=2282649 RepID=A0A3E1YGL2_9BACT|nr:HAMP domain-containing sensor histidine kinase [Chitinophaga silvatica]RFS26340.1 sensor histidine kinase [Chitinophaga silvatica]
MLLSANRNLLPLFKKLSYQIIGNPKDFPLENRIFNAICAIALFIIAFNVPYNYLTGLKMTSLIFGILVISFAGIYYLSRFRNKLTISVALSVIVVNILFAVNYFYSGGIQGASLLSFTLAFFLTMLISSPRQYTWWLLLNLATVVGVIIYEYYHPSSVAAVYATREDLFADMTPTYITDVVVIFVGTMYLKNAYRKEKERGDEKNKSLELMNAEKSKLFSLISHDLRNPLASIQSYLQLIKEIELEPKDKAQIEAELLYVVNNTQEMLYNILMWSKTQMDGPNVHLSKVNVSYAIQPILQINKLAVSKKKISLETYIDEEMEVLADLNMLQLIVRNLLGNASKFTPAGGTIVVRTSVVEGNCLIEVKDSGNGIHQQEDIFSLKVRSTFGTDNEKGVGMGLFLCREYTNAQNGKIWFQNNQEGGSSFYLELPLAN